MKVIFKKTMKASEDGINSKEFQAGIEYTIKDDLAESLLKGKLVDKVIKVEEKIIDDPVEVEIEAISEKDIEDQTEIEIPEKVEEIEEKAISNYENKMLDTKIENKAITSIEGNKSKEEEEDEIKAELRVKKVKFHPNTKLEKLRELKKKLNN